MVFLHAIFHILQFNLNYPLTGGDLRTVFFIKKTTTNSECQFKSDFGEYPPKPLLAMKLNSQFDVECMGKVHVLFDKLTFLFRLVFDKLPINSPSNEPPIIKFRNFRLELKSRFLTLITTLKNSTFQVNFVLFVVFLIVISPLLLLLSVILCIYIFIKVGGLPSNDGLGFLNRFTSRPSSIVVVTPVIRNYENSKNPMGVSVESTISHEHIHLRQAYYFPERSNLFEGEKADFLKSLLINPNNFEIFSYYFNVNEMEARLHEVVLSYYRKYGELPSDQTGFIRLFLGSRGVNREMMEEMKTNGIEPSNLKLREFDVRCNLMESQMLVAISQLRAPFKLDYLLKALPVLYGNLLIVYGDTNRAEKYFDTVKDFEFYNELYGEIIIPRI